MATPLLQYVARFNGGGENLGCGWADYKESRPRCSLFVGFPSLLFCCAKRRATSFTHHHGLQGDKSLSTIFSVFVPTFSSGQSVVADVEGVGFRPRAVVVGREVVSGCMRISSQEYVHEQ